MEENTLTWPTIMNMSNFVNLYQAQNLLPSTKVSKVITMDLCKFTQNMQLDHLKGNFANQVNIILQNTIKKS